MSLGGSAGAGPGLGAAVRRRRAELGITQRELAERANVSVRTVGKIEKGEAAHSKVVERIAATLGLADSPTVATIRVGALGPLVVWVDGEPQEVGAQKQRALLGLLTIQHGTAVPRDEIADVLWGPRPPPTWQNLIHTYVTRLRRTLGEAAIATTATGYQLTLADAQLDIAEFDKLVEQGELAVALDLWRGQLLADLPAELRRHPVAVALQDRRIRAALAYADAASGAEFDDVTQRLRPLISAEPLHEGLLARLMLALAAAGRQAEAINRYLRMRDRLRAELGVEPDSELQQAYERILRQDFPDAQPLSGVTPEQVPADIVGFSGRRDYLRRLNSLLGTEGPIVISAASGVGKTALAVHWANQVKDYFPDGQLYVDLAGYDHEGDALTGFLRALGVDGQTIPRNLTDRSAQFRAMTADWRLLMILDNVRSAEAIRPLLPNSPTAVVVVTSRDPLPGLVGAQPIELAPMSPAESRELLARHLDDGQLIDALAAQCAGLPLALRLAAALARRQPDLEVTELTGGPDQVYSWCFATLSDPAKRLCQLIALVPGEDVDNRAAAALLDSTVDEADRLLGEVVAVQFVEEHGGRFRCHDLLRDYLRTHGPTALADIKRLIEYYQATAAHAASVFAGEGTRDGIAPAIAWLATERRNLVAAASFAASHGWLPQTAALASALGHFLDSRNHYDDTRTMSTLVLAAARNAGDIKAESEAHFNLGTLHWRLSESHQALLHYAQARKLAHAVGDLAAEAAAHNGLGSSYGRLGEYLQSLAEHSIARSLGDSLGDNRISAHARNGIGIVHWRLGNLVEAARHFRRTLQDDSAPPDIAAVAISGLALVGWRSGQYLAALDHLDRMLELVRDLAVPYLQASSYNGLGYVNCRLGNYREAARYHQQSLALANDHGNRDAEGYAWLGLGRAAWRLGDPDEALTYLHRTLAIGEETGNPELELCACGALGHVCQESGSFDEALAYQRRAVAITRRIGESVFEAEALLGLAEITWLTGSPAEALTLARTGELVAERIGDRFEIAHANEVMGTVEHDLNNTDQALAHWRKALAVYTELNVPEADGIRRRLAENDGIGHDAGGGSVPAPKE